MSQRRHVTVIAGVATLLASVPLSVIFGTFTWLFYGFLTVGVVVGAAIATRAARLPVSAQAAAMVVMLGLALSWLFPSGREYLGFVPNLETLRHFGTLVSAAAEDMRKLAVPVPDRDPLLFLTTLGIGGVAITVDVLAVGLGHPGLAGLPMLAIYSVPVAVQREGVPWLPFAIGAIGYLWLLMTDNIDRVRRWGRRFSGDGRDIDTWEPSPLAAAGRRVGVAGIVLAISVPVALPSMSTSVFEQFYQGSGAGDGTGGPGTSQFVNPVASLSNNLKSPDITNVLMVETNDPAPFYLRLAVADQVTTDGFSPRSGRESRPLADGFVNPRDVVDKVEGRTNRAKVTMLNYNLQYLPLYAHPTRVEGIRGPWFFDPRDGIVWSTRPNLSKAKYTFEYVSFSYDPARLRQAPVLPQTSEIQRMYTRLPRLGNSANSQFIDNLVTRLTANKTTDYDKTVAVLSHFSRENNFRYSLEVESGTSGAAIVDFLTHKRGYCQQYAAAMAWLLRAAGIPARLVIGLAQGSRSGNAWTMTNQDFHAWVEVYFSGAGWVPFDPTPAVPNAASLTWAPRPDDLPDPSSDVTPGPDDSADSDPRSPLDRERLAGDQVPTSPASKQPPPSRWPHVVLIGLAVLLTLLAMPAAQRARIARSRRRRTVPADKLTAADTSPRVLLAEGGEGDDMAIRKAAHAAWDELVDTMVDLGVPTSEAETPRTTAVRLTRERRLPDEGSQGLRLLAVAEERARYARTVGDQPGLLAALSHARTHLKLSASRRARILAVAMPASVLLHWHNRYTAAANRVSTTAARWRDVMVRVSTARRLFAGRSGR